MDATWTAPKNIRQIGEAHAHYAVYIEDYVSTYIKQVVRLSDGGIRQGALVGKVYPEEEKTVFVIQGIVTDKELYRTSSQLFTGQGKEALQEQCSRFFAEMDIIGRVIFEAGSNGMEAVRRDMYSNNAGTGQILLHVDSADGTQEFCIGSQGAVELIESYYIYYERNEAMQNYLIAYNEETRRKVEEVHDIISGQARAAMGEVHMPKVRMQKDTLLICTTCALLICVTLLGIININQYQKMCQMEASFNHVIARLGFGNDEAVPAGADPVSQDQPGEIIVSDITPEDGLFEGLPVYVSDAGRGEGDPGDSLGGQKDEENESGGSGNDIAGNEEGQEVQDTGDNADNALEQDADDNGATEQNAGNSGASEQDAGNGGTAEQDPNGNNTTQEEDAGGDTAANEDDHTGEDAGESGGQDEEENGNAGAGNADAQQEADGEDALAMGDNGGSAEGYREYIVQRGDTLTSISILFYQDRRMIKRICELNGIENADNIMVGQKILLP